MPNFLGLSHYGSALNPVQDLTLSRVIFDDVKNILTISENTQVDGDLTVSGALSYNSLSTTDEIILLNTENDANTTNSGMMIKTVSSGSKYSGLFKYANNANDFALVSNASSIITTATDIDTLHKADLWLNQVGCEYLTTNGDEPLVISCDITHTGDYTSGGTLTQRDPVININTIGGDFNSGLNIGYKVDDVLTYGGLFHRLSGVEDPTTEYVLMEGSEAPIDGKTNLDLYNRAKLSVGQLICPRINCTWTMTVEGPMNFWEPVLNLYSSEDEDLRNSGLNIKYRPAGGGFRYGGIFQRLSGLEGDGDPITEFLLLEGSTTDIKKDTDLDTINKAKLAVGYLTSSQINTYNLTAEGNVNLSQPVLNIFMSNTNFDSAKNSGINIHYRVPDVDDTFLYGGMFQRTTGELGQSTEFLFLHGSETAITKDTDLDTLNRARVVAGDLICNTVSAINSTVTINTGSVVDAWAGNNAGFQIQYMLDSKTRYAGLFKNYEKDFFLIYDADNPVHSTDWLGDEKCATLWLDKIGINTIGAYDTNIGVDSPIISTAPITCTQGTVDDLTMNNQILRINDSASDNKQNIGFQVKYMPVSTPLYGGLFKMKSTSQWYLCQDSTAPITNITDLTSLEKADLAVKDISCFDVEMRDLTVHGSVVFDEPFDSLTVVDLKCTGGPPALSVSSPTANTNFTISSAISLITANTTPVVATLPSASVSVGKTYMIYAVAADAINSIAITRAGSDTIDGATSVSIAGDALKKSLLCITSSLWTVL